MAAIQVADKPTLDAVDGKCDDILDALGGGSELNKVKVFVGDFANDILIVTHGGVDTTHGYITT